MLTEISVRVSVAIVTPLIHSGGRVHGVAENDSNSDSSDNEGEATYGLPGTFVNKTNLQLTLEMEMNISHAAKHFDMVKNQREYFNSKKAEAFADRDKCKSERCYFYVADYAQNSYVPTFNSEQPGETYFYSPTDYHIFGVADASHQPTKLTDHAYMELDGKKGGNNVACLLWKKIKLDGLLLV